MEKVKVMGCQEKGKTKQNKPWYAVNLEDGRAPTGFEDLSKFVNQEIELDVFKNDKGYWAYKPIKREAGAAPNLRVVAAECTSRAALCNPDEINKILDIYYQWLTKE
jgi:hypothetical protein